MIETTSQIPFISFVIPVLNEKDNVAALHEEVLSAAKSLKKTFEIIFVDDGSGDGTVEAIEALSPVKLVVLRRNYGQTAALDAGIKAARGEYLVTMDGDLQNDPADVALMLQKLQNEPIDFVCGWRKNRKDTFSKRFISGGAKWLRGFLVQDGIRDSGCTLRVYKRECFNGINLRGEMHRFIPAVLQWHGFMVGEVAVNHRPRLHGISKYNFKRTIKGLLDMLSLWFFRKFETRPLHLLGAAGLLLLSTGGALASFLAIGRFLGWFGLSGSIWPLGSVFLMLFGFQLFVSGLIMDLIISSSDKQYYSIKRQS